MPLDSIPAQFANTRWSLVAALKDGKGDAQRHLLELCLHNWYPVYSYLRRCGHPPEAAQELTRSFFDQLLQEGPSRIADSGFGRFRQFLLAELHRFLSQERLTPSESGPVAPLSLEELEARQRNDSVYPGSPEQALRRGFALEIIGGALKRLRIEADAAGRLIMFETLERFLTADPLPGEFEGVATQLGARPLFVVMAVKRLRQRFRELIDSELCDTVLNTDELEAERQALNEALGGEAA
jgi:hypothetical protein